MKEAQTAVAKLGFPLKQPEVSKWSEEQRTKARNMIVRFFGLLSSGKPKLHLREEDGVSLERYTQCLCEAYNRVIKRVGFNGWDRKDLRTRLFQSMNGILNTSRITKDNPELVASFPTVQEWFASGCDDEINSLMTWFPKDLQPQETSVKGSKPMDQYLGKPSSNQGSPLSSPKIPKPPSKVVKTGKIENLVMESVSSEKGDSLGEIEIISEKEVSQKETIQLQEISKEEEVGVVEKGGLTAPHPKLAPLIEKGSPTLAGPSSKVSDKTNKAESAKNNEKKVKGSKESLHPDGVFKKIILESKGTEESAKVRSSQAMGKVSSRVGESELYKKQEQSQSVESSSFQNSSQVQMEKEQNLAGSASDLLNSSVPSCRIEEDSKRGKIISRSHGDHRHGRSGSPSFGRGGYDNKRSRHGDVPLSSSHISFRRYGSTFDTHLGGSWRTVGTLAKLLLYQKEKASGESFKQQPFGNDVRRDGSIIKLDEMKLPGPLSSPELYPATDKTSVSAWFASRLVIR